MDIKVTENAKSKLYEMGVSEETFLRIGVKSGGCSGNTYDAILDDNMSEVDEVCLLYTSPSPRDGLLSRMPSSA